MTILKSLALRANAAKDFPTLAATPARHKGLLADLSRSVTATLLALGLAACSTLDTAPINASVDADKGGENRSTDVFYSQTGTDTAGETLVGLTFSGGGTRAAAFSFGVLKGFADVPMGASDNLLNRVDFVSGVSGGSVTAAYFGLKGVAALDDFRERFLIRNAEEGLHTSLMRPSNWLRIYNGGGNDRSNLPKWLDDNLFNGATFADVLAHRRPTVWINASDIANHAPFVFEPNTFRAFCSDLSTLPLSEAVAASAAVPFIFAPISLKTFPEKCSYETPPWLTRGKAQGDSALLRAFARSVESYRDPAQVKYVRLLDGGITDNYGLSGLTIARAASDTPYGPLSPRQATRLRRALLMVVNAGKASNTDWARTEEGPTLVPLIKAIVDTGIDSSVRHGFDAFRLSTSTWSNDLIAWRCKLSMADVQKYRGTTAGWNCRDVKFYVGEVAFENLPERKAQLEKIVTSFSLPVAEVDLLIGAGHDVVRASPVITQFLQSLGRGGR